MQHRVDSEAALKRLSCELQLLRMFWLNDICNAKLVLAENNARGKVTMRISIYRLSSDSKQKQVCLLIY